MKTFILDLINEALFHLRNQQLAKMSLRDRVYHEKTIVKLEIARSLISKFIP